MIKNFLPNIIIQFPFWCYRQEATGTMIHKYREFRQNET